MQQVPNLAEFCWAGSDQLLDWCESWRWSSWGTGRTGSHKWDPTKPPELQENFIFSPAWVPHLCKQRAPRSPSTAELPQISWCDTRDHEALDKLIYPQNSHTAPRIKIPLLHRNAQMFISLLKAQEHPGCALLWGILCLRAPRAPSAPGCEEQGIPGQDEFVGRKRRHCQAWRVSCTVWGNSSFQSNLHHLKTNLCCKQSLALPCRRWLGLGSGSSSEVASLKYILSLLYASDTKIFPPFSYVQLSLTPNDTVVSPVVKDLQGQYQKRDLRWKKHVMCSWNCI